MSRITIIGAGPAGLVLGCLLQGTGRWDVTIIEKHTRAYVQTRPRAGLLEHRTVQLLEEAGLQGRLPVQGAVHDSCEFRIDGTPVVVKFGALTGVTQWVWPQQELVTDLIVEFAARGGQLRFDVDGVEVDLRGDEPGVTFTADGRREHRSSDWVAGADGGAGVSAAAVPPQTRRIFTHDQQLAWVSILAAVPPSAPHIVYAPHRRGFAGHML
ncbi:MAG: FAD-dependent monooxygenase, partial [Pseudonocardia sp.]|nr:FAD-dependent monooxygenase [Pseudonocardia sp.]